MGNCLTLRNRRDGRGDAEGESRRPTAIRREDAEWRVKDDGRKKGRTKEKKRQNSQLSRFSTDSQHVIEKPVRIGAFNVRRFGRAKMKDLEAASVLADLVGRFDVLLVVEIVDATGEAIEELLEQVNSRCDHRYELEVSARVGRTKAKEQYAFFYRADRFQVLKSCLYDDPDDHFIRDPFVVQLATKCLADDISSLTLVGVHTQPKEATKEIAALPEVVHWAKAKFKTKEVFVLGDLNAGGSYVSATDWSRITADFARSDLRLLIPDHEDTTTAASTNAAYDRIVACGDGAADLVIPGTACAYRFDEKLGIGADLTQRVSDHYPVEVQLRGRVHPVVVDNVSSRDAFVLEDMRGATKQADLASMASRLKSEDFDIQIFYDSKGIPVRVELVGDFFGSGPALSGLAGLRDSTRRAGGAGGGDDGSSSSALSYSLLACLRHRIEMLDFDCEGGRKRRRDVRVTLTCDARQECVSACVEHALRPAAAAAS